MSRHVVTLSMPARSEYLVLARLTLAGIARGVRIEEDVLADLKLAVTEACSNAVTHAYPGGPGTVDLRFVLEDGGLTIEVEDDGTGRTAEPPVAPPVGEAALRESGMGLAIIEAVVDELELRARADGATGTVIRMTKRF